MSNNGINFPMYNTYPYTQIVQQQPLYGQRFSNRHLQPPISYNAGYQMYPSMQNQPQYNNSYDHLIQSAAETLAAFTSPSEQTILNKHQAHIPQKNFHRRSVNNSSSDAKNSTRIYYCETCRIACGGLSSYQAHIKGSKHLKKETNSQNQPTNSNTFRCELCDIICTSSDAYKSHLDGSKHDKTVKLHQKLGKKIPESIQQPSLPINESQTVETKEEKQILDNNIKSIGMEYIETLYDNTNTIKSYYCKLCDCKFNDANAKDTHLKGKRHQLSYKKKVNPNFEINTSNNNNSNKNKASSSNETVKHVYDQQINHNYNQTETNEDTKYLMMLHEQIIPTQNLLNAIEQFVKTVESALKSCSEQLCSSTTAENTELDTNKTSLMGISRIGLLVKNLLIKSDRLFHLVVICKEWPTKNLFQNLFSLLCDIWKNQTNIQCYKHEDNIQVYTNINEDQMCISISFTSLSIQSSNDVNIEQYLSKTSCLNALNAMHSVRWFQQHVTTRQHASALIRCLRYKTKIARNWQSLSSEAIEILIEHTLTKSISPVIAFRHVLEYLAGGLILPNNPSLRIPWQTDSIKDAFDNFNNQQRNDITHEAQIGLRFMAFGQLNKWFEQCDIPQMMLSFQKRSYSDDDNESNSVKRQCTKSETIEEQNKS
ncbi:unnamed protein product [Adineta steineri]|uniref:Zinc finger RNA-binding protein n=1 Tax=Adineta steineri TaxID=433720 RepID=A0A814RB22_9BILA|nr:unnamed protein product [Adineta steineri]CAF3528639.1 unnamed protein product [Adineta steineri]